jgi:hypothetical protein
MWQYSNIILAVAAFISVWTPVISFTTCRSLTTAAIGSPSLLMVASSDAISDAKLQIEESIANTDRGRSINDTQRAEVHKLLSNLESLCPLSEPARDPRMEGNWIVEYTDAPPPSNGQLLFKGIAKQVINLQNKRYRNELYVGGSGVDKDENAWLSAILDARWEEWDGKYLDESGSVSEEEDIGGNTWKVDFESITLSLFQRPLFTQQFKSGTSRTWRMSYLDYDTRIVRAGKTGRGEDDWIFYMRRGAA